MTHPLGSDLQDNGWDKWQKLVLHELERLGEKTEHIEEMVTANKLRLAGISAVLGFIGGLIPVCVMVLLKVL